MNLRQPEKTPAEELLRNTDNGQLYDLYRLRTIERLWAALNHRLQFQFFLQPLAIARYYQA
jgi:hypothetical protein